MGNSSYGEVRKCEHIKSGVMRAVKILRKDLLDEYEIHRFTHEIEMLKRLDHPNIIKLYEFYEDPARYYLVTELCLGGELYDELCIREAFEEQDAAIIIQQILSAVHYCHMQHVVHRDLKPESILIDSKKGTNINIKLVDFGASSLYSSNK